MKSTLATHWLCLSIAAVCSFLAFRLDLLVWQRQAHSAGSIASGDFLSFQRDTQAMLRHALATVQLPYPPPFFLLSAPFSSLPALPGYLAWLTAGLLALTLAARYLQLGWGKSAFGLISPPALYCLTMGQSGLFVSAALLLALGLAGSQPILAGIAAGCLIIKPQFGLLLPVCFLAARNWRSFWAAGITVALLCLLATICFGPGAWPIFLERNIPGASVLLTAPAGQWQYTMVTVFMLCRSLGAPLALAGAVQAAITLAALFGTWRLWAPGAAASTAERLAASLFLTILATPYAYIYDLPALAFALIILAQEQRQAWPAIALFWFFTGFYGALSMFFFLSGALFIGTILAVIWPRGGRIKAPA
jgi:hypothetical protein